MLPGYILHGTRLYTTWHPVIYKARHHYILHIYLVSKDVSTDNISQLMLYITKSHIVYHHIITDY